MFIPYIWFDYRFDALDVSTFHPVVVPWLHWNGHWSSAVVWNINTFYLSLFMVIRTESPTLTLKNNAIPFGTL